MRLEIRDIESTILYEVGPEGAVLGRERARTDIALRDESISKRHARIFMQDGTWFLEDLNSSNGTYVDDQRITAPIRLGQGRVFSLAQRKFEVVFLEAAGQNGASNEFAAPAGAAFDETGAQMPSMPSADHPPFNDNFGFDDEPEAKGFGYFFVAVPKAIGFYAVQVPLMALNPIGRMNRSFRDQPLNAMTNLEVAAYAIPAFFFASLVGAVFGFLAVAVNGIINVQGLILALPAAGIAAAIGAVAGFISHPILKFLINLFKGESTPQSRTNYILFSFVFTIVAAIPNGIGALLAALPVPFINLLGPILLLLVTMLGLYYTVQWLKVFDVMKPIQYLVLGLGAIGVVLSAANMVPLVINAIDGVPSAGDGIGVMGAGTDGLTPEQRQALADNPEAAKALAKAQAAQKQLEGAGEDVQQALQMVAQKQRELTAQRQNGGGGTKAQGAPPPTDAPRAPRGKTAQPGQSAQGTQVEQPAQMAANPMQANLPAVPDDKYPFGITPFVQFLQKRDRIERAVDADPSLIERDDIRRDYERMWRITYDIRSKYSRKSGSRWKRDKIYHRQKGQEIFKRTAKYVDRVYRKLF